MIPLIHALVERPISGFNKLSGKLDLHNVIKGLRLKTDESHDDPDFNFDDKIQEKFSPLNADFENINFNDNSVDFAADFMNLQKLDSQNLENKDNSLNLGSAYGNNEFQYDDKVSSVQRDLSIENLTDEYKSIMNSSDMSNSENDDRVENLRYKDKGGLKRDKTYGKLSNAGMNHGMARIKSSVKLFAFDKNDNDNSLDSESISDLSTGDSAYPILSFKQRIVKEFESKIGMMNMHNNQNNVIKMRPRMSRVPCHTKLTYEPPILSKFVSSPPHQASFDSQKKTKENKIIVGMTSFLSDCSENINADEGVSLPTSYNEREYNDSRINKLLINKPFSRGNYIKPKSVIVFAPKSNYIQMRRRRAGYASKIEPK